MDATAAGSICRLHIVQLELYGASLLLVMVARGKVGKREEGGWRKCRSARIGLVISRTWRASQNVPCSDAIDVVQQRQGTGEVCVLSLRGSHKKAVNALVSETNL